MLAARFALTLAFAFVSLVSSSESLVQVLPHLLAVGQDGASLVPENSPFAAISAVK
jgi:hypothetical protein